MSDPVVITMPPGIFAVVLLRRARAYFEGFLRLSDDATTDPSHKLSHPSYFLYNHALELLLKAHLAASGESERRLAKLGHDLRSIHDACSKLGLPPIEGLRGVILTMAENNQDHDFRYPTPFNLRVPMPSYCAEIFRALEPVIAPKVDVAETVARSEIQAHAARNDIRRFRFASEITGKAKRRKPPG